MRQFLHIMLILSFVVSIMFIRPSSVLASEGDDGSALEIEVNGYHVTLASQNDWKKGENTLVVTLMDSTGMPVQNAEVEILIEPTFEEHSESEPESAHGAEQEHAEMPGMEQPAAESSHMPAHGEESAEPVSMLEDEEHGRYVTELHLESAGAHEVNVMFHVNGEMLQADFLVEILGGISKPVVLWSFVALNLTLITAAGILKRQRIPVKG